MALMRRNLRFRGNPGQVRGSKLGLLIDIGRKLRPARIQLGAPSPTLGGCPTACFISRNVGCDKWNSLMTSRKFVAYYRVSTAKQGRSGLGLDAQRKAVADYLAGGCWDLVGELVEVESGKVDRRPQLEAALARCDLTGATLVVAKLDRLSRNVAFLAALQDSGTSFVAADLPEANELTIHIMAAVAQAERKAISRRTKEALAATKARGTKLGGFRGNPHDLLAGPAASAAKRSSSAQARAIKVMRQIEAIRRSGAVSLRQIAAGLNAAGITASRGGEWQASQVKAVIERALGAANN